jgi:two-component system nitrogen regulation response regulator NtrX
MKRVLVIDDQEGIRDSLQLVLEMEGYEVLAASSGEEGIKIFQENGSFVLVVTDNDMPGGINGLEVIARLRILKPGQAIILFSGNDDLEIQFKKNPPNFYYLKKPAKMSEILAKVAEATKKSSLLDRIIRFIAKIMS